MKELVSQKAETRNRSEQEIAGYREVLATIHDLTVVSDQMTDSMGGMIPIIVVFSVVLYMLLVYLLSKVIIEKNAKMCIRDRYYY